MLLHSVFTDHFTSINHLDTIFISTQLNDIGVCPSFWILTNHLTLTPIAMRNLTLTLTLLETES